jgi:hypothetical protein
MKNALLVLCGAVVGGTLGYFACAWVKEQGFKGMVLPGGLLGIGAGVFKNRSVLLAVLCGLLALALGLFAEWRIFPFLQDDSIGFFLSHIKELDSITLLMIAVGGFIGFWMPFSRIDRGSRRVPAGAETPQSR